MTDAEPSYRVTNTRWEKVRVVVALAHCAIYMLTRQCISTMRTLASIILDDPASSAGEDCSAESATNN
jgi:hypothetical protein